MDNFEICKQFEAELKKAETQHPAWPKDIIHASAILNEEAGELTRACLNWVYLGDDYRKIIKEAIQTGAMAMRFLKHIENYKASLPILMGSKK